MAKAKTTKSKKSVKTKKCCGACHAKPVATDLSHDLDSILVSMEKPTLKQKLQGLHQKMNHHATRLLRKIAK